MSINMIGQAQLAFYCSQTADESVDFRLHVIKHLKLFLSDQFVLQILFLALRNEMQKHFDNFIKWKEKKIAA